MIVYLGCETFGLKIREFWIISTLLFKTTTIVACWKFFLLGNVVKEGILFCGYPISCPSCNKESDDDDCDFMDSVRVIIIFFRKENVFYLKISQTSCNQSKRVIIKDKNKPCPTHSPRAYTFRWLVRRSHTGLL